MGQIDQLLNLDRLVKVILETIIEMTRGWVNGYVWNSKALGMEICVCVWMLSKQEPHLKMGKYMN